MSRVVVVASAAGNNQEEQQPDRQTSAVSTRLFNVAESVEPSSRQQQQHHESSRRATETSATSDRKLHEYATSKMPAKTLSSKPIKQDENQLVSESNKCRLEDRCKNEKNQITASSKQSQQLAASLRSAANEGKVELVRLLLKCGADLNAQDEEFGNTALHQAAWNGFSETVQVLCKHRANTSIKNKAQFTPLHLACQQGHNQTARLLLMANAKAELKNSYGDTPLHTAARYGHAGVARILLSAKCNPNQVNKNNDTPLHIAAAMGRRKLTKILMQNGAELVIKNKQNETAMDIALRKDLIEIQELIANPPPKSSHQQQQKYQQRSYHNEQRHRHHRHRKSLTNLISVDNDKRAHQLGLSISSSNVQYSSGVQVRSSRGGPRLGTNFNADNYRESTTANDNNNHQLRASSQDFHNIDATLRDATNEDHLESGGHHQRLARRRDSAVQTPLTLTALNQHNHDRLRTRTLAAGLGVSSAALDELVGMRKRADTPTSEGRPRPNSVGSVRAHRSSGVDNQKAKPNDDEICLDEDLIERLPGRLLKPMVRPRLRSSPNGSLRSSRVGGRLRANRGLVPKPRRLSLAADTSSTNKPVGQPQATTTLTSTNQRRSTSVSILGSKLSLVQLRKMVKRRAAARRLTNVPADATQTATDKEAASVDVDKDNENSQNKSSQNETVAKDEQQANETTRLAVVGGRRQERIEREQLLDGDNGRLMRAPNGTKLLTTRPLAPLNDDSQLYAIPRKSSKTTSKNRTIQDASKQVTSGKQQTNEATAVGRDESSGLEKTEDLVESRDIRQLDHNHHRHHHHNHQQQITGRLHGPALTASDSGHSIASSNSSLNKPKRNNKDVQLNRLVSSSDEFIESLAPIAVAQRRSRNNQPDGDDASDDADSDDHDLSAPGYSVVRNLKAIRQSSGPLQQANNLLVKTATDEQQQPTESNEACSCSLGGSEVVLDEGWQRRRVPDVSAIKSDKHEENGQQVAADLAGMTIDANESRPSKMRQILRLEHKPEIQPGAGHISTQDDLLEEEVEEDNKLIRPRSVLGGASAELIAAQKSLAAAAAAKVHRDRLAKLARSKQETQSLNDEQRADFGELTVKTSALNHHAHQDSSFWLQHHQHHQTLVAAAAARVQLGQQSSVSGTSQPMIHRHDLSNQSSSLTNARVLNGGSEKVVVVGGGGGQSMMIPLGNGQLERRSGTNSVGMSDSSPSNNGADSDNSIQTQTSGSINTDHTISSVGQQQKQQQGNTTAKREHSGPFGILSRILMHNSSSNNNNNNNNNNNDNNINGNASKRANNNSNRTTNGLKRIVQTIANNSSSVEVNNSDVGNSRDGAIKTISSKPQANFSGSLSSSSALSSPSISTNGRSPNSTTDSVNLPTSTSLQECHVAADSGVDEGAASGQVPSKLLDQLSSRSRCPIVLSQSNGLPQVEDEEMDEHVVVAPRLPPKSALKPVRHNQYGQPVEPNAFINGLPRVSSYTQISASASSSPANQHHHQQLTAAQQHHNNLCNYHALNRSHMIQAKYSPYLPYALGRYSIHETCDPSTGRLRANPQQQQQQHPVTFNQHHHYQHHDDSIYIPPFHLSQTQGGHRQHGNHSSHQQTQQQLQNPAGFQHHAVNGSDVSFSGHHHQHQHQTNLNGFMPERLARFDELAMEYNNSTELNDNDYHRLHRSHQSHRPSVARPKSSLDSICFMSTANDHNGLDSNAPTATISRQQHYGQRLSAINGTSSGNTANPPSILKSGYSTTNLNSQLVAQCAKVGASSKHLNQIESSQLITQNSIYAPSNSYHHQHQISELTVLPTTSHQVLTANSSPVTVPSGKGVSLSVVVAGGGAPSTTSMSPNINKPIMDNGRPGELSQPPKLPPKTTTKTIGKLTRVSLNSSNGGQKTNQTVQDEDRIPHQREANDEDLYGRNATLATC